MCWPVHDGPAAWRRAYWSRHSALEWMRAGSSGCWQEESLLHEELSAESHRSRLTPGSLKAGQQRKSCYNTWRELLLTLTRCEKPSVCSNPIMSSPVDELEVSAWRMESACRVAIILSISSACCSRPTSSRASSAVKQRQKSHSLDPKTPKCWMRAVTAPVITHPVTRTLTDSETRVFQQQLAVWKQGYQPLRRKGCIRTSHSQCPSSHTRCCLWAENRHEKVG